MSRRKAPNYAAAHRLKAGAAAIQAAKDAEALRNAEAHRWDDIICTDPEDVTPEDREWADDYWDRTYGPATRPRF